jgi:hypothetical protein
LHGKEDFEYVTKLRIGDKDIFLGHPGGAHSEDSLKIHSLLCPEGEVTMEEGQTDVAMLALNMVKGLRS